LQTFALTSSHDVKNQLALIWGVRPMFHSAGDSTESMLKSGEKKLLSLQNCVEGQETIIMMAGRLSGLGLSSSVVVWTIGEDVPKR
jgi:pyruvate kinase